MNVLNLKYALQATDIYVSYVNGSFYACKALRGRLHFIEVNMSWIVPDVVLVGYYHVQAYQFKCLKCSNLYFPGNEISPFCEEHEINHDVVIPPWRNSGKCGELNIVGYEQRFAIVDKHISPRTKKDRTSHGERKRSNRHYREVYERDSYICQFCGYKSNYYNSISLWIDHVFPFRHSGSDKPDNLVVSCRECNSLAHDKKFEDFMIKKYWIQEQRRRRNMEIYDWNLCPFPELEAFYG
jgi:hypothetical protein